MKNLPLFFGVLLGTLALVIGVAVIFTKQVNAPIDQTRVLGDQHNATGSAVPKVTIATFSDLQCPACRAAEPLLKLILEQNSDQVRLVYRHYPLVTIHKNALLAAQAAEVAASAGSFWPFQSMLFDRQDEWAELGADEAKQKMLEYGETVGIPQELMRTGLEQGTFNDKVSADMADGDALGITGTPSFFVNGEKVEISALQEAVANALKE